MKILTLASVGEADRAARRARPRRPPPAVSLKPWAATILNVDTANNSGWAIYHCGELLRWGEVRKDDSDGIEEICRRARLMAAGQNIGDVLVLEKAPNFVYPGHQAMTLVGLGAARQAWRMAWYKVGGAASHIVSVVPDTWRRAVFGGSRATLPGREVLLAQKLTRMRRAEVLSDEAAAVCIGQWSLRCGEVGQALPKKLRLTV